MQKWFLFSLLTFLSSHSRCEAHRVLTRSQSIFPKPRRIQGSRTSWCWSMGSMDGTCSWISTPVREKHICILLFIHRLIKKYWADGNLLDRQCRFVEISFHNYCHHMSCTQVYRYSMAQCLSHSAWLHTVAVFICPSTRIPNHSFMWLCGCLLPLTYCFLNNYINHPINHFQFEIPHKSFGCK
jgi:hypothetical protein